MRLRVFLTLAITTCTLMWVAAYAQDFPDPGSNDANNASAGPSPFGRPLDPPEPEPRKPQRPREPREPREGPDPMDRYNEIQRTIARLAAEVDWCTRNDKPCDELQARITSLRESLEPLRRQIAGEFESVDQRFAEDPAPHDRTDPRTSVLVIEQDPRYEWRFLNHMLERQIAFRYQGYLLSAAAEWDQPIGPSTGDGNAPPTPRLVQPPWPATPGRKEQFARDYDVVVLGDIEPDPAINPLLEILQWWVEERGGALVLMPGDRNGQKWKGTPLENLVPYELPAPGESVWRAHNGYADLPFQWRPNADALEHPLLQIDITRDRSRMRWRNVPSLWWTAPRVGPARPGTIRLMHGMRRRFARENEVVPLMALRPLGKGQVLWLGADEMWRMRGQDGGVAAHQRYWAHILRWLADN